MTPHINGTYQLNQIDDFVRANGLNLRYRRWSVEPISTKNPPFLLIHGLASSLRIWDLVALQLLQLTGAEVVALDQRGHGLSDKPDSGYDTGQIVSDDYAVAQALKLEKPFLVGHSWGASIALAYAGSHPHEVSGIALVDGGVGSMRDRPGMTWERVEKELAPPDFAGTPREDFLNFFRKGRQGQYFAPVWNETLEDMVLNIVHLREDDTVGPRLSRANHMQILRALWETSNTELARNVTCPVLMVMAETPPADEKAAEFAKLRREGAEKMKANLASSPLVELVVMPDTVHDVPLQRPADLSKEIVRFGHAAGVLAQ